MPDLRLRLFLWLLIVDVLFAAWLLIEVLIIAL